VRRLVRELQQEYERDGRAFAVEEVAGGFQLLSRPEFAPYVSRLQNRQRQETLTKAALETLAIVAYRQPITRAEVEDIRGVQSGHLLRSLVEKRLLKVTGKSTELGRPLLYGTTRRFLEAFGLRSLEELPKRGELRLKGGGGQGQ
jgi:segregation and condensation protein B